MADQLSLVITSGVMAGTYTYPLKIFTPGNRDENMITEPVASSGLYLKRIGAANGRDHVVECYYTNSGQATEKLNAQTSLSEEIKIKNLANSTGNATITLGSKNISISNVLVADVSVTRELPNLISISFTLKEYGVRTTLIS